MTIAQLGGRSSAGSTDDTVLVCGAVIGTSWRATGRCPLTLRRGERVHIGRRDALGPPATPAGVRRPEGRASDLAPRTSPEDHRRGDGRATKWTHAWPPSSRMPP